jgi:hypothetical protein
MLEIFGREMSVLHACKSENLSWCGVKKSQV